MLCGTIFSTRQWAQFFVKQLKISTDVRVTNAIFGTIGRIYLSTCKLELRTARQQGSLLYVCVSIYYLQDLYDATEISGSKFWETTTKKIKGIITKKLLIKDLNVLFYPTGAK